MSEVNCEQEINLRTLKREDVDILDIVGSASQVAVYEFSWESNEWQKKDVEGSLFVFSRKKDPYYGFRIINRLNANNMRQDISPSLEIKVDIPYLLFKNEKEEIFCIWFYAREECFKVGQRLQKLTTAGPPKMLLSVYGNVVANNHPNHTNAAKPSTPGERFLEQFKAGTVLDAMTPTKVPVLPNNIVNHITPKNKSQTTLDLIMGIKPEAHTLPQSLSDRSSRPTSVSHLEVNQHIVNQQLNANPLTKNQLKETLIHLLENDADFLERIHSAYSTACRANNR